MKNICILLGIIGIVVFLTIVIVLIVKHKENFGHTESPKESVADERRLRTRNPELDREQESPKESVADERRLRTRNPELDREQERIRMKSQRQRIEREIAQGDTVERREIEIDRLRREAEWQEVVARLVHGGRRYMASCLPDTYDPLLTSSNSCGEELWRYNRILGERRGPGPRTMLFRGCYGCGGLYYDDMNEEDKAEYERIHQELVEATFEYTNFFEIRRWMGPG